MLDGDPETVGKIHLTSLRGSEAGHVMRNTFDVEWSLPRFCGADLIFRYSILDLSGLR